MSPGLGLLVLRLRGLLQDALDALGWKGELGEGDAAVERFAVVGNQLTAKPEATDPLEQNSTPMLSGSREA